MKLTIGAIVKNEADSILEWFAFHRIIGVDSFIIADNGSSDGTRELLVALSIHDKLILIDFPSEFDRKPQLPAYSKILRHVTDPRGPVAFVDADEFILPLNEDASIQAFVSQRFALEDVSAVALNWATFGSSSQLFHLGGLVIERFTKRGKESFGVNHHYKCIVRPDRVVGFDNPHHPKLRAGRIVDALGRDLVLHPDHAEGVSAEVIWSGARINHYAVKSFEEFITNKSPKGSATRHDRVKHRAYFEQHDRNDETCLLASALAPRVREEMARLESLMAPTLEKLIGRKKLAEKRCSWLRRLEERCSRLFR